MTGLPQPESRFEPPVQPGPVAQGAVEQGAVEQGTVEQGIGIGLLPDLDVQEMVIQLVRDSSLVSPSVAPGAPITWIPGVDEPWITVTDEAVRLAVIAHIWPIVGMLTGLQERIAMAASPRRVLLTCVDVDTEHDGSEVG